MRIVYVLTSLGMGGAERQVLAIASRMAGRGHTVALLVLRPQLEHEWPTSLPTFHLDMRRNLFSATAGFFRARRFSREFRPNLFHSHSFHANIFARLLKVLAPMQVVSTIHNVYEGSWHRMLAYRCTDFLSLRTTAVSSAAAERFVRLKAVPRHKCTVVPNAIDIEEFSPSAARRVQTRSTMLVTTEFVWLAAGRIVAAKDYSNLLRAFAVVHAAQPAARLWISGQPTSPEIERLHGLAHSLALERYVHWLGLRRDIPALLDAADGFVLASAWEGMPLVVGEAMAMEKPIVATDVGGVRELVGDTGLLVPSANSEALAAAMLDLMRRTPEERQSLCRAARARIAAGFSMEARTSEWESLYKSLLTSSR